MPLRGWKEVLIRTAREASKDNVGLIAAGVAFYAFLALVPLMGATVLTYGLVASPATVLRNMQSLTSVMPTDVAKLIGEQLLGVVNVSSDKKGFGILIALVVTVFGARNAAGALITALNIAYEEEEKRGFIRVALLAIAITTSAVVLALAAVATMTALRFLADLLPASPIALIAIKLVTGLVLLLGAAGAATTLYRYAPSREKAQWTWLTPGSTLCAVGWLALTFGFGIYVTKFGNYNTTYGSLGSVVVLLTWVYLSTYIFLFGAELNSEFEHQTAADTTEGGAKPLGTRGAWSADHVADGASDEGKEAETGDTAGQKTPANDQSGAEASGAAFPAPPANDHGYLVSRVTNRAARLAGSPRIGMLSSGLSTIGLAMLRRKGRGRAGAAILAAAAGLALLRRRED